MQYTTQTEWRRVTKNNPCPICERPDWCIVSPDRGAAICARIESDDRRGGAGWLHKLNGPPPKNHHRSSGRQNGSSAGPKAKPPGDWTAEANSYYGRPEATEKRQELSEELGISAESLQRLHVGWDGQAWTIPERNTTGEIVGLSRRFRDGSKRMAPASKRGLTYQCDWSSADGPVVIVEGASDTVAGMDLGLPVIGRPSNSGGAEMLAELLADWPAERRIIVMGEYDPKSDGTWPGKLGAKSVARKLADRLKRPLQWALPPDGTKDLRAWRSRHGTDRDALLERLLTHTVEPPKTAEPKAGPARWQPFPVDVLPETLRQYTQAAAEAIGCDATYVALPMLAALAGCIGTSRRIRLKTGWTEPAVIWSVIVGESGTLKSPALEAVVSPLQEHERQALDAHHEAVRQYEQLLEAHKADLQEWRRKGRKQGEPPPDPPEKPTCKRLLVSDTTVEALAVRLADNPRGLLLVRDELAGWFGSFDEYKNGKGRDVTHWLSAHRAGQWTVDRKSGDRTTLLVPRAAVSVTGGIQPEILRRTLAAEHFEDGLAARLLLAMPPRRGKRWTEAELSDTDQQLLTGVYDRLQELEPETGDDGDTYPRTVTLDAQAKQAWITFYNSHAEEQEDLSGALSAAWSKLEGYCARLALILHLSRWAAGEDVNPDRVDPESMEMAIALTNWFKGETHRVYAVLSETDEDRERRKLVELVERKGGRITVRQLQQGSRQYPTADEAEAALQELVEAGIGTWENVEPSRKGGRPTRVFVLSTPSTSTEPPEAAAKNSSVDVDTVDGAQTEREFEPSDETEDRETATI